MLDDALAALDEPWDTGPFGDSTRQLLAGHVEALNLRLRDYGALAARVVADIAVFVALFRHAHEEDENTVASFTLLRSNLASS